MKLSDLARDTKVFSNWDTERYFSGKIGDYIAVSEADSNDVYIINRDIFERTYAEAD
jgi:phosphoglycolate phosphatase